jgi:hypothetical protein
MYPVLDDISVSQSDETIKIPVWYCENCETTKQMTENEEIEASSLFVNRKENVDD